MNWDQIEGNWKQFKGKVKEKRGKLTDDDLDRVAGKSEQMIGLLQEKYGYTREHAEHFCPWYSNAARRVLFAADSMSAVSWTKWKSFPPVSPTTRG